MTGINISAGRELTVAAAVCAAALFVLPAQAARAQSSSDPSQSQSQAGQATNSTAKPSLAGTWKLNQDASDNPREKMREAMGAPNGGAAGGEGRGQEGGRTGRGPGRGGMMADFSQLTIEQNADKVKVSGASGHELANTQAENKSESNQDENNRGLNFPPAVAQWQGNQLVAKGQGFGGGTITRTFELSPDGKQLYVTTKMESPRLNQPVTYKQVYDQAKPESNNQ